MTSREKKLAQLMEATPKKPARPHRAVAVCPDCRAPVGFADFPEAAEWARGDRSRYVDPSQTCPPCGELRDLDADRQARERAAARKATREHFARLGFTTEQIALFMGEE
jgi:hypothetical protein